jgi:hypothetical protein
MQFHLRTLMIVMAAICLYCAILNAPPFVAMPIYCSIVWLSPAYWITGIIYGREGKRAFFIGGVASGSVPFFALVFIGLAFMLDGPWGFWRYGGRGFFGEYQLINLFSSLFIFAPLALAFLGAWIAYWVYQSLQPPKPAPAPRSPFDALPHPEPARSNEPFASR